MWRHVVRGGQQNCFDTKTQHIRELLANSGRIKVISGAKSVSPPPRRRIIIQSTTKATPSSGADDFRAFFVNEDLDEIGHIRGSARGKAVLWLALCQVMQRNVQHGLVQVKDPLARKFALIEFPRWYQAKIAADWLPRPLSNQMPHVFLLSGPDRKCAAQQIGAYKMFKRLGWEPKWVWGIGRHVELPHPRSHWADADYCSLQLQRR